MSASALLPIAGVAVAALAGEAASALGSGLSFAAELLRPSTDEGAGPAAPSSSLPSARERFAASLAQFARRLKQHMEAAGLAASGPIEIAADGLGGIDVANQHPQGSMIEALFESDSGLRDQFTALAEAYELLGDGSRHEFGLLIDGENAELIWPT
jgi:hypothetical protein